MGSIRGIISGWTNLISKEGNLFLHVCLRRRPRRRDKGIGVLERDVHIRDVCIRERGLYREVFVLERSVYWRRRLYIGEDVCFRDRRLL